MFTGMSGTGLTAEHFLKTARKYSAAKAEAARAKSVKKDEPEAETLAEVLDAAPAPPAPAA